MIQFDKHTISDGLVQLPTSYFCQRVISSLGILAHLIGDRLIPEQPLWVDRGILHVGPTKSLTF